MLQRLVNNNCDLVEYLNRGATAMHVDVMSPDGFDVHDCDDVDATEMEISIKA